MKLEMKGIGASDRKKVFFLAGLGIVLAYLVYSNLIAPSDDAPARASRPNRSAAVTDAIPGGPAPPSAPAANVFGVRLPDTRRTAIRGGAVSSSSRPEFKISSRENGPDPTTIDPTLRLDILEQVQSVNLEGGSRNLFQFGSSPAPRAPEPKIIPRAGPAPGAIAGNAAPSEPVKPPPPPIPLKFYGYTSHVKQGAKRAFFLDGDEIIVATEGQTIKGRYKIVRIGINSAVVEDVQFQNQQTLALEEHAG